jgi:hypothetical protein
MVESTAMVDKRGFDVEEAMVIIRGLAGSRRCVVRNEWR